MMKMLIKLDEEKVLRNDEYELAELWRAIDEKFDEFECAKEIQEDGAVLYSTNSNSDDFTCMGIAYLTLKKQEWFAKYCIRWIWYDNGLDNGQPPYIEEDVLAKERMRNPLFAKAS